MTDTAARPAQHHGNQITNLTLKIWRQKGPDDRGGVCGSAPDVSEPGTRTPRIVTAATAGVDRGGFRTGGTSG